ncbi:hypothetical protein [Paenibacillus sp. Leaf72]|uniref:hypothetical protein n=1 Tax=Paenibacillus sp. Leaf72 TaxID=1736234 RepID=UPI0006F6069C|nr:hypothetical protein [Paenibacillus sp. Leaf72]KQN96900.1 hypothetical protein ASF12_22795 [Paenibacillus sp. Leaf72]
MSKSKMGLMVFDNHGYETDIVAPKEDYASAELFLEDAIEECKAIELDKELALEMVQEDYCKWYKEAPEDVGSEGSCYALSEPGEGSFPIWRIDLQS